MNQIKTHRREAQGRPRGQRHDVRQHHDHVFPGKRRNPPRHRHSNRPSSSWPGSNCNLDIAGRYIRLPYHGTEGHKTLGNWYTTLLNAHGNPDQALRRPRPGDGAQEAPANRADQAVHGLKPEAFLYPTLVLCGVVSECHENQVLCFTSLVQVDPPRGHGPGSGEWWFRG